MIIEGDALIELSKLEGDSIDLIATDPPYGLSFMGKDWDKAVPSVDIWKDCLRVLKPGAFAFVMCIPRQDCLARMICNLSDAGFETGFTSLYWAYASGFPKAQNIGKAVDKKLGIEKIIAKGRAGKTALGQSSNWNKTYNPHEFNITEANSPQAKALDGSYAGFQPKPAVEVILVAMKPMEHKTYVEQALDNRKGIVWFDDCRVPYESEGDREIAHQNTLGPVERYKTHKMIYDGGKKSAGFEDTHNPSGRFPANLLVNDDVLDDGRVTKSGKDAIRKQEGMFVEHKLGGVGDLQVYHPDSGSFSRYFDLDRWFAEKIKQLPASVQKTFPFLICPKASKSEKNKGCEDIGGELGHNRFDQCAICGGYILQNPDRPSACKCETPIRQHNKVKGNFHPTCKPLKLMSYLITLGSREGDTVLDPFVGSGTTCLAAKMLGRKSIGIEIKRYYFEIAKGRNEAASK